MKTWLLRLIKTQTTVSWIIYLLIFLYFLSLSKLISSEDRVNHSQLLTWYLLISFSFLGICITRKNLSKNLIVSIAILSQLICFFYLPNLSTDYYRFLWDGELLNSGINPYDFTPNEYALNAPGMSDYMKSLHQGMGRLSASNYSCYPTINQLYFYLSTIATDTISSSVFVMRSLIFLTQLMGGWACLKIFDLLNKNPEKVLYLFLNPLLVIECSANLHFEGVMLSFILLSIYFVMKTKTFLANSFFALAIHIKLIPLLIYGCFLKLMSLKNVFRSALTLIATTALLFIPLVSQENISNFFQSLQLYFSTFEFNSFIILPLSEFVYLLGLLLGDNWIIPIFGERAMYWNPVTFLSPLFGLIILIICIRLFSKQKKWDWDSFFETSVLLFLTYYLLSATVHPWYLIIPLGLSIFSNNIIPLVWSVTILISYGLYDESGSFQKMVIWTVQYLPIILLLKYRDKLESFFKVVKGRLL